MKTEPSEHEYIVVFAKREPAQPKAWRSKRDSLKELMLALEAEWLHRPLPEAQKLFRAWFKEHKPELGELENYKNLDEGGIYAGRRNVDNPGKEGYRYDVIHPITNRPVKQPLTGWRFSQETMQGLLAENKVLFGKDENKLIEIKFYLKDYESRLPSVIELDGRAGANELKRLLPDAKQKFAYPKPSNLLTHLFSFALNMEGDIDAPMFVLDSFAGSGTTGQAVSQVQSSLKVEMNFLLVEMDQRIAQDVTAERLRRLDIPFRYCTLGETLFTADGMISGEVTRERLAHHLWFTETGEPLPHAIGEGRLIGVHHGTAILYLEGALTVRTVRELPAYDGPRVVYADACRLSAERLAAENLVFKAVPYDVRDA